jgi:hypothetical protein
MSGKREKSIFLKRANKLSQSFHPPRLLPKAGFHVCFGIKVKDGIATKEERYILSIYNFIFSRGF